jgi:hypothetical protein
LALGGCPNDPRGAKHAKAEGPRDGRSRVATECHDGMLSVMGTGARLVWGSLAAAVVACGENECDLDAALRAKAGSAAKDCGHARLGADPSSVDACVLDAFAGRMAFIARYDRQGIDSQVVSGVAGDGRGGVVLLLWDSAPCGGPGCAPALSEDTCNGPSPGLSAPRDPSQGAPFACESLTSRGQTCGS